MTILAVASALIALSGTLFAEAGFLARRVGAFGCFFRGLAGRVWVLLTVLSHRCFARVGSDQPCLI